MILSTNKWATYTIGFLVVAAVVGAYYLFSDGQFTQRAASSPTTGISDFSKAQSCTNVLNAFEDRVRATISKSSQLDEYGMHERGWQTTAEDFVIGYRQQLRASNVVCVGRRRHGQDAAFRPRRQQRPLDVV
jgi:hypothetical protein